tara:strand:+ start:799 stop:1131 length:333 start_codon:yes stop_codon:yes gene_type:complete
MAYVQKNNPIAKTPCGRRRAGGIGIGYKTTFKKLNVKALEEVSKQLEKASNTHAGQAKKIKSALPKIKRTKISAPCKAAAKRKFKVWPSAYASGWGVRCTRNPRKYLKRK